jgi:aryl-alcohol dehydrogenase-like predicted oxidoreductase
MFPAELIVEARWAADNRATYRFTTEQPMYSIFTRKPEAAVFPTAQRYGLGVLTFSPLNSGWLTANPDIKASHRAALAARLAPQQHDPATAAGQRKTAAAALLAGLAAQAGMTMPHLAVAFARAHPAVTSVLIGPRTQDHLETLLDGADIELTADILDRIDEIVPPGTDLDPADNYAADPPALTDPGLRRR